MAASNPSYLQPLEEAEKAVKKQRTCEAKVQGCLAQLINLVQASRDKAAEGTVGNVQQLGAQSEALFKEANASIKELHGAVNKLGKGIDGCASGSVDIAKVLRDVPLDTPTLNKVMAQHFFRQGCFDVGRALVQESGLAGIGEELAAPFTTLHVIQEQIRNRNTELALQWADAHLLLHEAPPPPPSTSDEDDTPMSVVEEIEQAVAAVDQGSSQQPGIAAETAPQPPPASPGRSGEERLLDVFLDAFNQALEPSGGVPAAPQPPAAGQGSEQAQRANVRAQVPQAALALWHSWPRPAQAAGSSASVVRQREMGPSATTPLFGARAGSGSAAGSAAGQGAQHSDSLTMLASALMSSLHAHAQQHTEFRTPEQYVPLLNSIVSQIRTARSQAVPRDSSQRAAVGSFENNRSRTAAMTTQAIRSFQFRLHSLTYLTLLTHQGQAAALEYARSHFTPFSKSHMREIQQLMGCLVYCHPIRTTNNKDGDVDMVDSTATTVTTATSNGSTTAGAGAQPGNSSSSMSNPWAGGLISLAGTPYEHLQSPTAWEDCGREFLRLSCSLMGLAAESPLATVLAAGAGALPKIHKLINMLTPGVVAEMRNADQLPLELDLGPEFVFHPIFACPVSRDQSTPDNPPMLLPCGHVLCEQSVLKIAKSRTRVFKCPYCPVEAFADNLRPLVFPEID